MSVHSLLASAVGGQYQALTLIALLPEKGPSDTHEIELVGPRVVLDAEDKKNI